VPGGDYGKDGRAARIRAGALPVLFVCLLAVAGVACGTKTSAFELTPETAGVQIVPITRTPVSTPGGAIASSLAGPVLTPTSAATGTPRAAATATGTPSTTATVSITAVAGALMLTPTPEFVYPTSTTSASMPADALTALNALRVSRGLKPFQLNGTLTASASAYAKLMADKSWFGCGCDPHTGPDGSQPDRRAVAAGYRGLFRGEALAAGQVSGPAAVSSWLSSPSHAFIILDSTAVEVGLGYAYNPSDPYHHYWVLETGIPSY
jgi:uncharacterized protein YkwD